LPYKGHKSITVPDELYDKLYELYQKNKAEYKRQGITSFSGFVSKYLWTLMDTQEKKDKKGPVDAFVLGSNPP
jgi:hypothetical protein